MPTFSTVYLSGRTAPYTPATLRGAWNDTGGQVTREISPQIIPESAVGVVTRAEAVSTNPYAVLLYRGVSGPLNGQTISGTLNVRIPVFENNADANFHWHVHVYVTQGDSDTPRGTLLTDYTEAAGVNEWGTTAGGIAQELNAAQTVTNVVVTAGDRLVVEIGYEARNATAASRSGSLWYGTTVAFQTDIANGAATGTGAPFLTFGTAVDFAETPAGRVTQLVAEVLGDPDEPSRVTQLVAEVLGSPDEPSYVTQLVVETLGLEPVVTVTQPTVIFPDVVASRRTSQLGASVRATSTGTPATPPLHLSPPLAWHPIYPTPGSNTLVLDQRGKGRGRDKPPKGPKPPPGGGGGGGGEPPPPLFVPDGWWPTLADPRLGLLVRRRIPQSPSESEAPPAVATPDGWWPILPDSRLHARARRPIPQSPSETEPAGVGPVVAPLEWQGTYPDYLPGRPYQSFAWPIFFPGLIPLPTPPSIGVARGYTFRLLERATGRYRATLVGRDGVTPLLGVQLTALRLTLYAILQDGTDTIVNGRAQQNVLNQNDVTVGVDAVLTWLIQPGDTTLIDPAVPVERHIALFEWSWPGGAGKQEVILVIHNLRRVP